MVGFVFQNLGLWEHLTVEEHIRFVLSDERKIKDILEFFGLTPHNFQRSKAKACHRKGFRSGAGASVPRRALLEPRCPEKETVESRNPEDKGGKEPDNRLCNSRSDRCQIDGRQNRSFA